MQLNIFSGNNRVATEVSGVDHQLIKMSGKTSDLNPGSMSRETRSDIASVNAINQLRAVHFERRKRKEQTNVKPKSQTNAAQRMQARIDAMQANMQEPDPKLDAQIDAQLAAVRNTIALDALRDMKPVLTELDDLISETIRRLEAGIPSESQSKIVRQDFWMNAVVQAYELEQLLWYYCDASKLGRNESAHKLLQKHKEIADDYEIRATEDKVMLRIPYLSQYGIHRCMFTEDMLLFRLAEEPYLPKLGSCHATFVHVFPTKLTQLPKDVTNYNYRRTIDLLGAFCGFSDCASKFSMTMDAVFSDDITPGTYITLVRKAPVPPLPEEWEAIKSSNEKP